MQARRKTVPSHTAPSGATLPVVRCLEGVTALFSALRRCRLITHPRLHNLLFAPLHSAEGRGRVPCEDESCPHLFISRAPLVPSQHTEETGSWPLCLSTAAGQVHRLGGRMYHHLLTATGTLSASIAAAQARQGHLTTWPSYVCASLVHPPATSAAEEPFLLEPAPTTAAGPDTEDPIGPGGLTPG